MKERLKIKVNDGKYINKKSGSIAQLWIDGWLRIWRERKRKKQIKVTARTNCNTNKYINVKMDK